MEHDYGVIIAVVGTGMAIVGVVIAMMFWCRTEANVLRAEAKEDRKDLLQISRSLELSVHAIQAEMKDFHQRLLDIERCRSIPR
jgi:fructose-1,6-bisphosphatase/inositol monophosphatase family enzyme